MASPLVQMCVLSGEAKVLKLLGEDRQVELVRRDDVPSMRTIVVNGVEHWLAGCMKKAPAEIAAE